MSNQKAEETQTGFKIDFSHTPFSNNAELRNENIRKIAARKKSASDFKDKCASEGFSIVLV